MKALALFSGGLDSLISIKLIQNQGIEVIPVHFVSYFFGKNKNRIEELANQLGCKVEFIDIKDIHLKIIKSPKFGYGRFFNPCIDCHGLMLNTCVELLPKYDAQFVITGEVLGQRPKSQMKKALDKVNELSGLGGLLLRPLSAKKLPISLPEKLGWVNRELLLDIEGRRRNVQMNLARQWNLEYQSPGGGCILTDFKYSEKFSILKKDGFLNEKILNVIQYGRFLRISSGEYLIVGRDKFDNFNLKNKECDFIVEEHDVSGPIVLGFGNTDNLKNLSIKVFNFYCKNKGNSNGSCKLDSKHIVFSELSESEKKYIETIFIK